MKHTKRIPSWENPLDNQAHKKVSYAGTHIVADFWFGNIVEDPKKIESLLLGAAKEAASTILKVSIHKFFPQGITGIVLLAESHIALHSWPEINYFAIDIFTCGKNTKPKKALEFLKKHLAPKKVRMQEIKRGKIIKKIA